MRYRVEWQKNGVEYFDIEPQEGDIEIEEYADEIVYWAIPNTVEYDIFVEGEHGWEQKL